MKIYLYTQSTAKTGFKGVREDRNTVSQLKENNDYSLNELNQRRINTAINNLAKQRGEENIQFLLNVGENLKYQTNIDNGKVTKNDWKGKLKHATEESLAHSNPILKEKYTPEITRIFGKHPLTKDEIYISSMKKRIINRLGDAKEKKDIDRNLDYFITSTETPIEQKKYIMKRLDYFMSPKYEINPQLKDKKAKVLSEMVNDITINTPESKIPNVKAINQKTHGMCAAISIARKTVAYEDKPNYVDSIIEELNSSDTMKIYDLQNLGKGKKVSVTKAPIDFDYAQSRGYRIVDASTLQWMNIAGMYGAQNESLYEFNPFDKNNFDAFHDTFFMKTIADEKIKDKQSYFQALTKAKDEIISVRSKDIKNDIETIKNRNNYLQNINELKNLNREIRKTVGKILPKETSQTINNAVADVLQLQKPISDDIKKNKESIRKYSFIPNEEESQKIKKLRLYFEDNYKNVDKKALDENIEILNFTTNEIHDINSKIDPKKSLPAKISQARRLYETEAIYRVANILGFMEDDTQTDYLIHFNIPDRETRILKGLDKIIDQIENNNDETLLNHYSERFGTTDKKEIIDRLTNVKNSITVLTTTGLDNCYYKIGMGDRRAVILSEIGAIKESILNGNTKEVERAAKVMGIKPEKQKILKEYTTLENNICDNPGDEEVFIDAYNKLGAKNQVNTFIEVFHEFVKNIDYDSPNRDLYLSTFFQANNLEDTPDEDTINEVLNDISNQFNAISQAINAAENLLDVRNKDGSIYFTVYAPQILIKKMENNGELVKSGTMQKLQTRFNKIDKLRSTDEFASRQGKISDPSLYKLSKEENDAIKQIDKKLNRMYKNVTRNLNYQYRDIKEPLKEMASYVGTNSGKYWVPKEGSSGLYTPQQVKIFEQITDKPYRPIEDIEEAINIIKNSPHSGTSGTSVFHDRIGGHAQYVADIKPVGKSNKEALFHDNTWGPSEHENEWKDSEGLIRTDYSDRRGGELGYITDDNYRNGNYIENLLYKKGHISPDETESKIYKRMNRTKNNEYDFSMMGDIIVSGKSPEYRDIAHSLKDAIFIPSTAYISTLEKFASEMTQLEIKKRIEKNHQAGKSYRNDYKRIMDKITTNSFHKGIDTREEYNALPDNDEVKLAFEKAAIRNSYDNFNSEKAIEIAHAKTLDDLKNVEEKQRRQAYKLFEYSFGKTNDVLISVGIEHNEEIVNSLVNSLKKHNVKITGEQLKSIVKQIAMIKEKDYDGELSGSLKDTIEISVKKAEKQFDKEIPESENSKLIKEEWLNDYRNILTENSYFNKEDLKLNSAGLNGIKHWIDRKFKPNSDEEFVEIYKKIQDMPRKELQRITQDITDEELGIKRQSGFNILQKVKGASEEYENLLRNTLFSDKFYTDIEYAKTAPVYRYTKLEKLSNSSYYKKRTFDDLYHSFYNDLQMMEYPKMFRQNEDYAYREYGALPAYPKIDLSNDQIMNQKVDGILDTIEKTVTNINIQKNIIYDIQLINKMDEYRKAIPDDRKLTPMERENLYDMVGHFITANCTDEDFKDSLEAAYRIYDIDKTATMKDWNTELDVIIDTVHTLEKVTNADEFKNSIKKASKELNNYFNLFVNLGTTPQHRRTLKKELVDILNLESKISDNGLDYDLGIIDLQKRIQDNSKDPFNKTQTDKFGRLKTMINKTKKLKQSDNVDTEKIEKQIKEINDYADKYVQSFIKPERQEYIKSNINDWLSKELVGNKNRENTEELIEKLDQAKQKFKDDYFKNHILNNATTILDEYLLLSAKDAPVDKNDKKKIYRRYLENALNLSKFIEVQDVLMSAEDTGNPAMAKEYFKDFNVILGGDTVNMDSDDAVDYMVRSLILDDNMETAKMLVEKLGLGDRIMSIEKKIIKNNNPAIYVDETANILTENKAFIDIIKSETNNMNSKLDTEEDTDKICNQTKINIANLTKDCVKKNNKMKKSVENFIKGIDNGIKFINENPELPRSVMMSQLLENVYKEQKDEVNKELMEKQEHLQAAFLVYRFLTSLHLPEGSKGEKIQKEMKKDYEILKEYATKMINIVTEDMDVEFVRG